MKKALSLILALVMCLSLCACGGNTGSNANTTTANTTTANNTNTTNENSDEIALTLDNYSKYLSVTAFMNNPASTEGLFVGAVNNGMGIPYDGGSTLYVYRHFSSNVTVEGVSTNFNYNDVSLTVRFTGTYKTVDINTRKWNGGNEINSEVTVECNIAGEGSIWEDFSGNGGYMLRKMADVEWEVVAISGTVTPAN